MASNRTARAVIFRALTLLGVALLAAAYVSPIWWVSLKAPNYPPQTFPDGVRIEFFFDKVANGCQLRQSKEVEEEGEALDCVHEMNTINHYIGMHPIEQGARLEQASAPFIFAALGVALLAFMVYSGPFWWLLAIPAIVTPIGFVVDYAGWLWWFGHTLSPMGAFTVKPFMPTVFGEGKVAQFSTFSYPSYGFALLLVASVALTLAVLIRRQQLRESRAA